MTEIYIVLTLVIIAVSVIWLYTLYTKESTIRKKQSISFKESLDLTELPVVTFYQGKIKINFILDTGSNLSIIDKSVADRLQMEPNKLSTNLIGIEGNSQNVNTGVMKIAYKDMQFEDIFQIIDMSRSFESIKRSTGVKVHGILGNAFLQKYQYVLDFEAMIAYSKRHK